MCLTVYCIFAILSSSLQLSAVMTEFSIYEIWRLSSVHSDLFCTAPGKVIQNLKAGFLLFSCSHGVGCKPHSKYLGILNHIYLLIKILDISDLDSKLPIHFRESTAPLQQIASLAHNHATKMFWRRAFFLLSTADSKHMSFRIQ